MSQSSGAVWMSRWPSSVPRPYDVCGRKATVKLNQLWGGGGGGESGGGRGTSFPCLLTQTRKVRHVRRGAGRCDGHGSVGSAYRLSFGVPAAPVCNTACISVCAHVKKRILSTGCCIIDIVWTHENTELTHRQEWVYSAALAAVAPYPGKSDPNFPRGKMKHSTKTKASSKMYP